MRIIGEPIGMGQVTPGLETISGGYRYKKDPTWTPGDPRYRHQTPDRFLVGSQIRAARRLDKIRKFAAELAGLGFPDPGMVSDRGKVPGWAITEAGMRAGVSPKTARGYLLALRRQEQARVLCLAGGHDWQPAPDDPEGQGDGGMSCYRCRITEAEHAEDQQREGEAGHG